ncbi:CoxG family protein [Emcibacter nanhaiensis]|uniref:Carbon monoxide dehydrogenase subunit G n=1 Tax=Emcibacter nanhaiensis TaxID=1505037 RepID=A0A501PJF0_9PROT|nr:carbon monoxide dehydrogenase subunit G [Emcibacter nanhaiensis]TPD60152.1 carbon monoxide dehydrogenase subunit G [Emcibacter nanhaiensis]
MKITGENEIPATKAEVWEAINDPEILAKCIPGCESMERIGENSFKAKVTNRIGPVTASFEGQVELSDLNPPHSYTLSGAGSAGSMGNAKGAAKVTLTETEVGTKLSYDVDAEVTGKIAQLGGRLIQSTANMLAGQFFKKLAQVISVETGAELPPEEGPGVVKWVVIGGVVIAVAVVAYVLLS